MKNLLTSMGDDFCSLKCENSALVENLLSLFERFKDEHEVIKYIVLFDEDLKVVAFYPVTDRICTFLKSINRARLIYATLPVLAIDDERIGQIISSTHEFSYTAITIKPIHKYFMGVAYEKTIYMGKIIEEINKLADDVIGVI